MPYHHGVEIDIRSRGNKLVLHHEPFCEGTDFEEWLEYFNHALVILNIKEEGVEKKVQSLIDKKGINNYFYLDLSFPFLVKLVNSGQKNIAARLSKYESIETCLALAEKIDWVWVDYLDSFPLNEESYQRLIRHFKICLVSPELVGRENKIKEVQKHISEMKIDAVCTKLPQTWQKK